MMRGNEVTQKIVRNQLLKFVTNVIPNLFCRFQMTDRISRDFSTLKAGLKTKFTYTKGLKHRWSWFFYKGGI